MNYFTSKGTMKKMERGERKRERGLELDDSNL
jgi:hypothetical protein